jgi:hypothetical protein
MSEQYFSYILMTKTIKHKELPQTWHDTDSRKETRTSSTTSFTAIKFNWNTITDRGNMPEYYLKPLSQSMQRKTYQTSVRKRNA